MKDQPLLQWKQHTEDARTVGQQWRTVAVCNRVHLSPQDKLVLLQMAEVERWDYPSPLESRIS